MSWTSSVQHRLMWGITCLSVLVKGAFIFLTPAKLLATTIWIIDDAFIEMSVARNIAHGMGFSYDFIHPTTGSPFFWTYIIALPHLFVSADAAIQWSLFLSTIAGALSCAVVYYMAKRITGRSGIAWTAFFLCLLSGNAFFNAMNGMDTSIFTLFSLLAIATALGVGRPNGWSPWAWGAVSGVCAGLAVMTRADGIFVIAPIALFWLLDMALSGRKSERKAIGKELLAFLGIAGLCLGIYVTWHMIRTGSPVPANQVGRRELALALQGFATGPFSFARYVRVVVWNVFQLENLLHIATGASTLGIIGATFMLFRRETRRFAAITLAYTALFFGMLAAYQWYFPDFHGLRYVNTAVHLFAITTAYVLWMLPEHRLRPLGVSVMTAGLLVLSGYLHYQLASRMPWGKYESYIAHPSAEQMESHWHVIDWMKDHLPKGTVVGVRDHGRVAYFTELPIQDLAGNIDPNVPKAVKDGTLREYLKSRNVTYMLLPNPKTRSDLLYQVIFRDFVFDPVPGLPATDEGGLFKVNWEKTLAKKRS